MSPALLCGFGIGFCGLLLPGLLPPIAGCAWHCAQLFPLNPGPRPAPPSPVIPPDDRIYFHERLHALREHRLLPSAEPRVEASCGRSSSPRTRISLCVHISGKMYYDHQTHHDHQNVLTFHLGPSFGGSRHTPARFLICGFLGGLARVVPIVQPTRSKARCHVGIPQHNTTLRRDAHPRSWLTFKMRVRDCVELYVRSLSSVKMSRSTSALWESCL